MMLTQSLLPFKYTADNAQLGMTSFAGLPLYMDLAMTTGLCLHIAKQLHTKQRGWADADIILSLILLNLAGGDCVDDIDRLEADEGMKALVLKIQTYGMKRKAQRAFERRWRKRKERAFPSASAIRRYLEKFHHAEEELKRVDGQAFIPANNELLDGLVDMNQVLVDYAQQQHAVRTATLDQDATLSATNKRSAFYCYKQFKAYQPLNTYWHEQGMLLHSEFRDGNVNAGYEQLRLLKKSLELLPHEVEAVYLRSDSAGYQHEVLDYCAGGKNERFGVIEFAIAARVSAAYKAAVLEVKEEDWHPIYKPEANGQMIKTDQEWAEVCFVPNFAVTGKNTPSYRYLAIRERQTLQLALEGLEPKQQALPFQTLEMNRAQYKLFGIVTNRTLPGNELINWHRERCGDSEKCHSVEKQDLAGGQFPSDKFGANAAWWQIMVLAYNLNELMKRLVLPEALQTKRLKGLRYHVIGVAGRLVQHARGISIKLSGGKEVLERFNAMRARIAVLAQAPPSLQPT